MKDFKVGVQLYSVREQMKENMEETLKAIKEMGYDYVEFAGYFGRTAEEVKAILDKYDLKCVSVHQVHDVFLENGEKEAEFLQKIGVKYSVVPWMDVKNFQDDEQFSKLVNDFKNISAMLKKYGIKLAYHNHDFEFGVKDNEFYLDRLFNALSPDELDTQIDTCWVHYAGVNPSEYVRKYKGRATTIHLKDFECKNLASGPVYALVDEKGVAQGEKDQGDTGFEYRPLGEGRQNIMDILKACEEIGTEYLIVEQDDHPNGANPMDNIKKSRDYLKSLGI